MARVHEANWDDFSLSYLAESASDAVIAAALDTGRIVLWNRAAEALFGYEGDEARGMETAELAPVRWRARHYRAIEALRESDETGAVTWLTPAPLETPALRKDGTRIWVEMSLCRIHNERGRFLLGVLRDITEWKRTSVRLRDSEARFKAFMDHSPAIAFMKDTHNRLIYVNAAYERIFRLTRAQGAHRVGEEPDLPELALKHYDDNNGAEARRVVAEAVTPLEDGPHDWLVYEFPIREQSGRRLFGGMAVDITEQKRAQEALNAANNRLTAWVEELEQRTQEMTLLCEMGEMLLACRSLEEAYSLIAKLMLKMFVGFSGRLYARREIDDQAVSVAAWGTDDDQASSFAYEDCWALRRGQFYLVTDPAADPLCEHVSSPPPASYLCVPLMAQNESLGVLHLFHSEPGRMTEAVQRLARTAAEQISMALGNLKLQETLRAQSIRDPLTGLFNRRYMEASLERELHRAERNRRTVGIIMVDIDHFKHFNDVFGHNAGDAVLRELGRFLCTSIRSEDIACRYGGDEFMLILPDATLEETCRRADQLRDGVKRLHVEQHRQPLGPITLSLGGAVYPHHGGAADAVLRAADTALYRAKHAGRDRVAAP
ncbi:MAG TPA: diguanylate cyclase [Armatimonadota bacterium]|nr:diguanylate cyclase [Armatimonadota bacterium]